MLTLQPTIITPPILSISRARHPNLSSQLHGYPFAPLFLRATPHSRSSEHCAKLVLDSSDSVTPSLLSPSSRDARSRAPPSSDSFRVQTPCLAEPALDCPPRRRRQPAADSEPLPSQPPRDTLSALSFLARRSQPRAALVGLVSSVDPSRGRFSVSQLANHPPSRSSPTTSIASVISLGAATRSRPPPHLSGCSPPLLLLPLHQTLPLLSLSLLDLFRMKVICFLKTCCPKVGPHTTFT